MMATKSILTPVRSSTKMESPSSNRVLGAIPKVPRRVQLVELYPSTVSEARYARSPSGLHAIRPDRMKTKRKPCAEAGVFPIKPTFSKKAANTTVLGADSSNSTLRVKTPTVARKLSLTRKTPNRANLNNKLNWNDLRTRVGAAGEGLVTNKKSPAVALASASKNKKRRSMSVRTSRHNLSQFKSRIPVRVALMDPKVLEDLEKEEQELVARLAIVRDKIRKVKAQVAVRRPPPPPPADSKVSLPVVEHKAKPVSILRMKEGPPPPYRPEPESPVARYFSPVARAAMKRRSLSLQSTVMLTSPEFQLNVESPTVNSALLVNSPFGTATPPWAGKHLLDPTCGDSVVKLTNVPVDVLLAKDRAGSPTALYSHLRQQTSILHTPDGSGFLRRRNSTTGEPMDLRQIAQLNSVSKRVQAQLASLYYGE